MLINILCLIIGIAATLIWIKVVKAKILINYQKFAIDKFWLFFTGVTIVAVAYLYFYLPQVFKWLAVDIWGVPASTVGEDGNDKLLALTDLGSLGDIYGSLNTLFTSATLAFVVYATLLQRQANKDARDAMKEQLQQAKDAIDKQLQQACDAVDDQLAQARASTKQQLDHAKKLSDLQLDHAKEVATQQLELVQKTHDAQIKESKDTIFSNTFYNLLTLNRDTVNSLKIQSENMLLSKQDILERASNELTRLLREEWQNNLDDLDRVEVSAALRYFVLTISGGKKSTGLYSSFYNYKTLINYVKKNKKQDEWKFYFEIIANSMSYTERKLLLWLSLNSRNDEYLDCLKGTYILDLKLEPRNIKRNENVKKKEERELMLLFINHFRVDPTSFKYHPDLKNELKNPA